METQGLIQRLDLYPRLMLRLPSLKGFSIAPSIGVRETYYSSQMSDKSTSGIVHQSLNRHYAELNVDLKTPVLERDYSSSPFGRFTHTIEPFATYRQDHPI